MPRQLFALYTRDDGKPPPWRSDMTSSVFVVLTPIADASVRQKTGADYFITDISFTTHMFCLESELSKYGLHPPANEIYVLPGTDIKCFDKLWAQ